MVVLTLEGERKVEAYICELYAKRKEILDAGKDTADDTEIPDINDIISDIEIFVDKNGDYYNDWGVTDNYNSDHPLSLSEGIDFYYR